MLLQPYKVWFLVLSSLIYYICVVVVVTHSSYKIILCFQNSIVEMFIELKATRERIPKETEASGRESFFILRFENQKCMVTGVLNYSLC